MQYNSVKDAHALWDKFLSSNGSWQAYLCFNGTHGMYSLVRSSDYTNRGFTTSIELSYNATNRSYEMVLRLYNKATSKMQSVTVWLRSNIAAQFIDKIGKYWECINGYQEWE